MANNRRLGRECAIKMLFAFRLDAEQADPNRLAEYFWDHFRFADDALGEPLETATDPLPTAVRLFAETLVRGVISHRPAIDQRLKQAATNWSVERMAAVDLSILRLAAYELLYQPDIPVRVTLNEAIEIAKRYGTKESPSFINGLLDKIAAEEPSEAAH